MNPRQRTEYMGLQVARWRERRCLSQAELSAMADISRITLIRIEQGSGCNTKILFRIADVLDVPCAILVEKNL